MMELTAFKKTSSPATGPRDPRAREKRREAIIELIKKDGHLTIREMAVTLRTSARTVHQEIEVLKLHGRIERVGSFKYGRWEVIE